MLSRHLSRGLVLVLLITALNAGVSGQQLSVDTQVSNIAMYGGETRTFGIGVTYDNSTPITIEPIGDIEGSVSVTRVSGPPTSEFRIMVDAPRVDSERYINGNLLIRAGEANQQIPLSIHVLPENTTGFTFRVSFLSDSIALGQNPRVHTQISRAGDSVDEQADVTVNYEFRRSSGERIVETSKTFSVGASASDIVGIDLENATNVTEGSYYVQAFIIRDDEVFTRLDTITITQPFWTPWRVRLATFLVVATVLGISSWKGYQWYRKRREEEARYVYPVDYDALPNGDDLYWVGKVAETSKEALIDPADLTTHAIVAGSTGAGKSVTASVIVEEALEQGVPVVVFDPTAQWTGFVKKCVDDNLLDHYDRFDMDPSDDPHPYKGLIKKVDPDDVDIDFEGLMNEGEVTVFTLSHLSTEKFDEVVREIIDSMFEVEWEESPDLELLVVFDEVHRLLEEYGGQGGYQALERGAREFRKWGIGLIMASQVTADFKQAVSGNIMTEVQMQTKSMEDINRIETKYGEQFAKRISSEEVGTGMIQHPEYNDGDPWFVDFRPTYHNPHKIPDEELEKYYEFTRRLDNLEDTIDAMEEEGEDVYDQRLELRLARDKLKEGRFKMAEIYIESLEDTLDVKPEDA